MSVDKYETNLWKPDNNYESYKTFEALKELEALRAIKKEDRDEDAPLPYFTNEIVFKAPLLD